MSEEETPTKPKWKRVPCRLRMDYYEVLKLRAEANDRFDWQELERIVKDVLRPDVKETPDED